MEVAAVDAICDLLGRVPTLKINAVNYHQYVGRSYQIDARIGLSHGEVDYALIIEVKSKGAPSIVRSAIYQLQAFVAYLEHPVDADVSQRLIPMLVSPYLSPESRAICMDHDVAYLDLFGNARLAFDTVYIDRSVADKPKSESRALRSIFTPKAAAILRAALREPSRVWRVADLADKAKASLGHVSNVRRALLEREWAEKQKDGVVLIRPDALLKTWRENYRRPTGHRITGYTYLHGQQLNQRLSRDLNPYAPHPRAIYSLNAAAQWLAPFGRGATTNLYADESGVERLKEILELTPANEGANVVLRIPNDESLFDDAVEPAPGIFCTGPVTTYLDLWIGNDRDREAAAHLAREFFPWLT